MTPPQRSAERPRVAAIILAAGASTRLGEPKQLLDLSGRPLLQHVVDAAASADLRPIVIVLGHAADEVEAALDLPAGARTVINARYAEGQSTSLRAGLDALDEGVTDAAVLLGDQPTLAATTVRAVVDHHIGDPAPISRTRFDGAPGHPVVLDRAVWPLAAAETGDRGARRLLESRPDLVSDVKIGGPAPPDVDTQDDYEALRRGYPDRTRP